MTPEQYHAGRDIIAILAGILVLIGAQQGQNGIGTVFVGLLIIGWMYHKKGFVKDAKND